MWDYIQDLKFTFINWLTSKMIDYIFCGFLDETIALSALRKVTATVEQDRPYQVEKVYSIDLTGEELQEIEMVLDAATKFKSERGEK